MKRNKILETAENAITEDINKIHKDYGTLLLPICLLLVIIICIFAMFIVKKSISAAADAASNSYITSKEEKYEDAYKTAFNDTYNEYRLSQDIVISYKNIREISKLEVLKVSEQGYTIQDEETKDRGITYWTNNMVFGIYTVDLSVAEFIVDDLNDYVLIKVPEPTLSIIPTGQIKTLLFKKKGDWVLDGNISVGSELAQKQLKQGEAEIAESIKKNSEYKEKAKSSTIENLKKLIKALNPNIKDLSVDVVFFD